MDDLQDVFGEQGFDTSSAPPASGDFEPLPAGWYPATVDAAEVKPTKSGNGKLLAITLTVIGEHFANRKLFHRINLANPNTKAVEIGMRELAALGLACGLANVTSSQELVGHDINVKVKVNKEEGRDPDNRVVTFAALDGAPATKPETKPATAPAAATAQKPAAKPASKPVPQTTQAAPAAKSKRPWEK